MDITPPTSKLIFLTIIAFFVSSVQAIYEPQALLSASTSFLNHQLCYYGPDIKKLIDEQSIPPLDFNGTEGGVNIFFNLTNTTQQSEINFNQNILEIKDEHSFVINSKNINVTINGHLEFKVGPALKQKGELIIKITQLQTDTTVGIAQPKCPRKNQGLGFDIQIEKVYVHANQLDIQIEHKNIDNLIINALKKLLISRLPSIIETQVITIANPLITTYTCNGVEEMMAIGNQNYIIIVNTTQLPVFNVSNGHLNMKVDVTFINELSNKTNNEVININMPETTEFYTHSNLTLVFSSNMLNTILWVIDDSDIISQEIKNEALTTSVLSILVPSLNKKWPARPVILKLATSSKFSHLYFRNGKIVAALSLSAQFIVNATGKGENQTTQQCLASSQCYMACNLNMTALLSVGAKIGQNNLASGLLDSIQIAEISLIEKLDEIVVDIETLEVIIGNLLPAYRPQINKMLQDGYPLPIDPSTAFNITNIYTNTHNSYTAVGIRLQN